MQSQNKSILRHAKAAYFGSILSQRSINLGLLIGKEMATRAKKNALEFPEMLLEILRLSHLPPLTSSGLGPNILERRLTRERQLRWTYPWRWILIQYLQRHLCLLRPPDLQVLYPSIIFTVSRHLLFLPIYQDHSGNDPEDGESGPLS
ncbi:hypothetical protein H5410_031041 [Solanum commersonii]|uniref:Uncharacterized protein n=1 Tax=Solanum commersonii TaxID=4109 RepID=A0A9J5YIQ3_SOLCO|nr:hypothetical protein H5410_031041 [Solanum commersonii]